MTKYGIISTSEEMSHGAPITAVKVMDHIDREVKEVIVPRIDTPACATMRECGKELLMESHRINQMMNDGLTLSPEYVVSLLQRIGNELVEADKEAR